MVSNKIVFCFFATLILHAALNAQQLTAYESLPTSLKVMRPNALLPSHVIASLPDAPMPQGAVVNVNDSFDDSTQSASQSQATPANSSDAQQPTQPETAEQRRARAEKQIHDETHQRIAGVLPAFNSVQGDAALPFTSGQKFHLFFRGSIDPYQFAIATVDAGIEEAEDQYPEYHWGISGLARRIGASYADSFDGNFWGNAVLPSLLHQDPRYYRLGRTSGKSGWHRFFYAASTTVICHGDNGKLQPNYSNVLGNFIGGAISNAYYPASDRGVGLTISRGATTTAEGIVGAEPIEFYPDYVMWRKHKHEQKLARRAAAKDAADGAHAAQDPAPPATVPSH